MIYKKIYEEEELLNETSVLFGPFYLNTNYKIIKETKLINKYIAIGNITDKSSTRYYSDLNENQIYANFLPYGRKLYSILKEDIIPIYGNYNLENFKPGEEHKLINEKTISKYIKKIEPICIDFLNNYGIPFDGSCEDDKDVETIILSNNYNHNYVIISDLVHNLILIYVLHSLFRNTNTFESSKYVYKAFNLEEQSNDKDIIKIIIDYINSPYSPYNNYKIKMIFKSDSTINIRYTDNIFTLSTESFINDLCTLSFKSEFNNSDKKFYTSFRKCKNCLKTIADGTKTEYTSDAIPKYRKRLCDNCSKKAKQKAIINYENSVRKLVREIKELSDLCNNQSLLKEVNNIKMSTVLKSELKDLKSKLLKEIEKENGRN